VRFEVLTSVLMKIKDLWDIMPCRLVNIYLSKTISLYLYN